MGWLERLRGHLVALDTSPIIYLIEEHPRYLDIIRPFFEAIDLGEIQAITSSITLLEVMVHPFRRGEAELAHQYREILLHSSGISCLPVSSEIAEDAAQLRAQNNLGTPDAIQLATAIRGGASHFLTNDHRIPALPSLSILVLDGLEA